jgi:hypothetical protein
MTPEEEKARIREVQRLIEGERDPEKIKVLAAKLNRLLIAQAKWLPSSNSKPKSS